MDTSIISGNYSARNANAIDRSGPNCWAPEAVYQCETWHNDWSDHPIIINNLVPGTIYLVECHNAEAAFGAANSRVFTIKVNGETAVDSLDMAATYGQFVACCIQKVAIADANGRIVIDFINVKENPRIAGVAVWGKSAPSAITTFTATKNASAIDFAWSTATDTLRYYIQKAESETGPWSDLGEYVRTINSISIDGCFDPSRTQCYRLVASNGVGVVTSQIVTFAQDDVTYTDIATRGETIPNDATANLRITTVASDDQPLNVLAADTTSVAMLMQNAASPSTLAIGANQTFKAGTIGILNGGAALTIGETAGQGTLAALNESGLSIRTDAADANLTLNVSPADMVLTKYGLGTLTFAAPPSFAGTLAIAAGSVISPVTADTDLASGPTLQGSGTFVKTGAGTLTINESYPDMTGDVVIREGKAIIADSPSVPFGGDSDSALRIESGATLDMTGGADNNLRFGIRRIVFEGAGPDGNGALQNTSERSQYNVFADGELSGDATVNTVKRFDFRKYNNVGFLLMNNHTLTKIGGDTFGLTDTAVTSGGSDAAFRVDAGTLTAEVSTTFDAETPGSFILANNGAFDFYNLAAAISWPFTIEASGGKFSCRTGNSDTINRVTGTVTANGPLALSANNDTMYTLEGKITGPGSISRKEGGVRGRVNLVNPANDYTGETEVNNGILYAKYPGSLPGYDQAGHIVISNIGKLLVPADNGTFGWGAGQITALMQNATAPNDGKGCIAIDTQGQDITVTANVDKPVGIGKSGDGTLLATGAFTAGGMLWADQGELILSNQAHNVFTSTYIDKTGIVRVADSEVDLGAAAPEIGSATTVSKLILDKGAFWHANLGGSHEASPEFKLGAGGWGVLEINDGAVMSNRVTIGTGGSTQGAIHQYGGILDNWCGWGSDGRIGYAGNSYGYWEISGGEGIAEGYFQLGNNPTAIGILSIKENGSFRQNNTLEGFLGICRGGTGVVYQAGGTFTTTPRLYIGDNSENNGTDGYAVFTIDGENAVADLAEYAGMAARKNMFAQLNINGGVFTAKQIIRDGNGVTDGNPTGSATVSINGGTFKSKESGNIFGTGYIPDALHTGEKGATFDTAGFNSKLNLPITLPTGLGVKAIRYTASNLFGPPHVTISGDGQGATAVADFDSRTGTVKGIIVTNPGWDYTTTPTVTLKGGGLTDTVTLDASAITMGTTTGGSLTKEGAGALTLTGANTYTGETIVNGGTLIIGGSASITEGTDLTLDGGNLVIDSADPVKHGQNTLREGNLTANSLAYGTIVKEGEGVAGISGAFSASGVVTKKGHPSSGLNMQFTMDDNSGTYSEVVTSLDYADTPLSEGVALANSIVNRNVTCTYTGYIWNRSDADVTWTFAENFDDLVDLKIDGNTVLDNGTWNAPTKANYTLSPGSHTFSLRLHQGTGGSGSVNSGWWTDTTKGVVVDFQGRNAEDISCYERMIEDGYGTLFTTEGSDPEPGFGDGSNIIVREGILRINAADYYQPGLAYGFIAGDWDYAAPCPKTYIDGTLNYVHKQQGEGDILPNGEANRNVNCIYSGYIWNQTDADVTWTFAEYFDDSVYLTIDGEVILNNTVWDTATHANATLSPGAHKFELHLYQGTGGSGPSGSANAAWWTDKSAGMLIDFSGRNSEVFSNYVKLADPGDGSLFTMGVVEAGTPALAADTTFAIQDGGALNLAGSAVTVKEVLSAGGAVNNGTLGIASLWTVDCADLVEGKTVAITGKLDLSSAPAFALTGDTSLLRSDTRYVIATTTDGITGEFGEVTGLPGNPWSITVTDSNVILSYKNGTLIIFE